MNKEKKMSDRQKGDIFFGTACAAVFAIIGKRKSNFIPSGKDQFVLMGLNHDYLCNVYEKRKYRRGETYFAMRVIEYTTIDEKLETQTHSRESRSGHIGERHNISIKNGDHSRIIKILSH